MASDTTLRAIITVMDRTELPITKINQRFSAMTGPLSQIGAHLSRLAEETGLVSLGEHAGRAFEKVRDLGGELLSLAGPVAALGAAGSIFGLIELTKSTAELGEQAHLASIATGMSVEQFTGWQYAAKLANIDTQQLGRGFEYLNKNIALAAGGKSKDVEAIFSGMGIANTPGHLLKTADALRAVAAEAQHLVNTGNTQTADAMMAQLFGARSGMALLPLFAQGPAALSKILDEAKQHGVSFGDSTAAEAVKFEESYKAMSAGVDGLRIAIGSKLFPAITPVIDKMTHWIDANREWLASSIGDAVKNLADTIGNFDWSGFIGGFKSLVSPIVWLSENVLGLQGTILALAALTLSPLILSFGQLGKAVGAFIAKWVAFPIAMMVGDILSLIPAIGGAADAFAAFDLVLAANPIGVVVLAIGALGAAAYEIYEHWEPVSKFFSALLGGIAAAFDDMWQKIKPIVDALRDAVEWIGSHMPNIAGPVQTTPSGQSYMVDPSSGAVIDLDNSARAPLTTQPGGGPGGAAPSNDNTEHQIKLLVGLASGLDVKNVEQSGDGGLDLTAGYAMGGGF